MNKLWNKIIECIEEEKNVVLVTVIDTLGSTPRSAGAKMLVDKDGILTGTIGGGAVEYKAIELAKQSVLDETSFIKEFSLNREKKSELGMVCGGNMTLAFQFISFKNKGFVQLCKWIKKEEVNGCPSGGAIIQKKTDSVLKRECWLVTKVVEDGEWEIGLYTKQGSIFGWESLSKIEEKNFTEQLMCFDLDGWQYYSEPFVQEGKLYIFGGGHVAQEIVPVASRVGFSCIVFDDREEFSNKKLFPLAEQTIVGDFEHISEKVEITENDYVAIMSRGHECDYIIQKQMLKTPAFYIGVMGSKKKLAYLEQKLLNDGFTKKDIERFQSPIGTDIMAETPEEIAISVVGELIRTRALKRKK
ncbi:XdhC family protein [Velocimicrobium porci]|uniref:XdhC family protein n=1 Tax=Velocimicrobium porci TaxID=2606634 RepID=A0A6L5Y1T8_9FIRM|nr:XdhC/CoxI family protein [Velocimicrobium porci]MSS64817.1 XdhC family protein [Velocimicrobium porci]